MAETATQQQVTPSVDSEKVHDFTTPGGTFGQQWVDPSTNSVPEIGYNHPIVNTLLGMRNGALLGAIGGPVGMGLGAVLGAFGGYHKNQIQNATALRLQQEHNLAVQHNNQAFAQNLSALMGQAAEARQTMTGNRSAPFSLFTQGNPNNPSGNGFAVNTMADANNLYNNYRKNLESMQGRIQGHDTWQGQQFLNNQPTQQVQLTSPDNSPIALRGLSDTGQENSKPGGAQGQIPQEGQTFSLNAQQSPPPPSRDDILNSPDIPADKIPQMQEAASKDKLVPSETVRSYEQGGASRAQALMNTARQHYLEEQTKYWGPYITAKIQELKAQAGAFGRQMNEAQLRQGVAKDLVKAGLDPMMANYLIMGVVPQGAQVPITPKGKGGGKTTNLIPVGPGVVGIKGQDGRIHFAPDPFTNHAIKTPMSKPIPEEPSFFSPLEGSEEGGGE